MLVPNKDRTAAKAWIQPGNMPWLQHIGRKIGELLTHQQVNFPYSYPFLTLPISIAAGWSESGVILILRAAMDTRSGGEPALWSHLPR